jgi:dolichol-phosphate mannosyltransferase
MMDISIIIPVLNEVENISPLSREITDIFAHTSWEWECIWIDDGSKDGTPLQLENLFLSDGRHRYLVFEKHAGQSAALLAGFQAARGHIICTLDGDGQNDPANLPSFIEILQSHDAEMIAGYRVNRRDNWIRKVSSAVGNAFQNYLTGKTVKDVGCATRVMKKSSLMTIPFFSGMHRFIPNLFLMKGYRIIEAPAHHRPRLRGYSKYGICNRLGVGLVDCFGVMWLKRRTLSYKVIHSSETTNS